MASIQASRFAALTIDDDDDDCVKSKGKQNSPEKSQQQAAKKRNRKKKKAEANKNETQNVSRTFPRFQVIAQSSN